jgi:uncharacterized protein YbbC (DUF1343 family)
MKKLTFILSVKYKHWFWLLCFLLNLGSTNAQIVGAEQVDKYLPFLKNKKVGLVVNQTSTVGSEHLVDFLKKKKVNLVCIFAPEHGFRGDHSAGEKVKTFVDEKSKLTVFSLYGSYKKPNDEQLKKLDIVIFDIQDVGARFYTYISTLHYVMEACAEQGKTLIVLDRPNPNGFYVDGPILDTAFKSFIGMHPVPVVHGCTIAEYAKMINGEGWLKNKIKCNLVVIPVKNYTHQMPYSLPIKPSPNLPTMSSVYLYPSLCFFEGTNYSVGRGTNKPFERVGKPNCTLGSDTFTPKNLPGIAEHPPFEGKKCQGFLLSDYGANIAPFQGKLNLYWLIELYKADSDSAHFFTSFFEKLAGTDQLRKQIVAGKTEEEIRKSWQPGLNNYRAIRKKYLIYSDQTK